MSTNLQCAHCGTVLPPNSQYCGACGRPPAHALAPASPMHLPPPLRPYPLVMQHGLTRLTGQMFVAPHRLYFICESRKGGLAVAMGKAVGGLIGGVIASIGVPVPGQAAPVIDEQLIFRAAHEHPGSLMMDPQRIKAIKDTFWTHAIWFDGNTYALRETLHKELKLALGRWCQANNVKHAGLLPK